MNVTGTWPSHWHQVNDAYNALLFLKDQSSPLSAVLVEQPASAKSHIFGMLRSGLNLHGYRQTPIWVLLPKGMSPNSNLLTHGADGFVCETWGLTIINEAIDAYWRQMARLTLGNSSISNEQHAFDSHPLPNTSPVKFDIAHSQHTQSNTAAVDYKHHARDFSAGATVPSSSHSTSLLSQLTPREREVLSYLRQGATNQIIAEELSISPTTVKNHLAHVFKKLRVQNRTQAATMAHELFQSGK